MEKTQSVAWIGTATTIVLEKIFGQLKIFRLMRLFYYRPRNFWRICFWWFWWQFLHARKYPISIKDKAENPFWYFRMYLGHNGYSPPLSAVANFLFLCSSSTNINDNLITSNWRSILRKWQNDSHGRAGNRRNKMGWVAFLSTLQSIPKWSKWTFFFEYLSQGKLILSVSSPLLNLN